MLVNEQKLEQVVSQVNQVLAKMDQRLKELEDASKERPKTSTSGRKRVQQTKKDS